MIDGGLGFLILLMVLVACVGFFKARIKGNGKTSGTYRAEKLQKAEEKAMGWMLGVEPEKPKKKARPVAADIPKVQAAKAPEQQMSTVRPERIMPADAVPGQEDPYALSTGEFLEPDRLAWGIVMAEILGKPKGME